MPSVREDPAALVAAVRVGDAAAPRRLLNAVVGSRTAKRAFVAAGAVPALVAALPAAPAAAAFGSLACSFEPGAAAAAAGGAAPALVSTLFATALPAVQAAARALKILLASSAAGGPAREAVLGCEAAPGRVVALLADATAGLAETCGCVIAAAVVDAGAAQKMWRAGAVPALVRLLEREPVHEPSVLAGLAGLAGLVGNVPRLAGELVREWGLVALVLPLLRARGPVVRMVAARLLMEIHCAARESVTEGAGEREDGCCGALVAATAGGEMDEEILTGADWVLECEDGEDGDESEDGEGERPLGRGAALHRRALSSLVTELVELLRPESPQAVRIEAPRALTRLVEGSPRLQQLACESGVMEHLGKYLESHQFSLPLGSKLEASVPGRPLRGVELESTVSTVQAPFASLPARAEPSMKASKRAKTSRAEVERCGPADGPECELVAGALECFAGVCALWDDGREACIRQRVLPFVILAMKHRNLDVVSAAVKCVRSLSRTVKIVRRELVFVNIAVPLLALLKSESIEVKRQASACICNVAVEFSPLKDTVVSDGGIPILVDLLRSDDCTLRLNALWALQNMMFKAKPETRVALMNSLGFSTLVDLCEDSHHGMRSRAMMLLRNLVCCVFSLPNAECVDMDALLDQLGGRLFPTLAAALAPESPTPIALQALYAVCNIASGPGYYKDLVLQSEVSASLLRWTYHADAQMRVAALWCAINLGWNDVGNEVESDGRRADRLLSVDGTRLRMRERRRARVERLDYAEEDDEWGMMDDNEEMGDDMENPVGGVEQMEPAVNIEDEAREEETAAIPAAVTSAAGYAGVRMMDVTSRSCQIGDRKGVVAAARPCLGRDWRLNRLRDLGLERRSRELVNDKHVDVIGRALRMLDLFGSGIGAE